MCLVTKTMGLAMLLSVTALEQTPWWKLLSPVVSDPGGVYYDVHKVNAVAGRGVYHSGWYGYWSLDDQRRENLNDRVWKLLDKLNLKKVLYYDSGEVGDYAIFIGDDGKVVCHGWGLPWWGGRNVKPFWFGLDAFMKDVEWAPYPTAKNYGLTPFTMPDGTKPQSVYDAISIRDINDEWQFDYFSNPKITDEIAQKSGLSAISEKQEAGEGIAEKSGWITGRLVHVDFSNPQLREYRCREIARLIKEIRPDGVHIDNHGDLNIYYPFKQAFGVWSVSEFRKWLQKHSTNEELRALGIEDVGKFDIREYVRNKRFSESQKLMDALMDLRWTEDPIWLRFLIFHLEMGLNFHRAVYESAKNAAKEVGLDIMVGGNAVPLFPGRTLLKGACDIACFEWTMTEQFGPILPLGLPPKGRLGHATKIAAKISDADYCWATVYVPKKLLGHQNLFKVIAFECLANKAILDYGPWIHSPEALKGVGFVNWFILTHRQLLSNQKPFADVALVYCPYTELTTITPIGVQRSLFLDEYIGWANFLSRKHYQWDVLLSQDLTSKNLNRFSVIILPSVRVLTEEQLEALLDYTHSGGRIVATGATATRLGPAEYLAPRAKPAFTAARYPRLRITNAFPGAKGLDNEMADLLAFDDWHPILETDASETVGTYLHWNESKGQTILRLDLVNYDIDVPKDEVNPTLPFEIRLQLPKWLKSEKLTIVAFEPEAEATGQKVYVKMERLHNNKLRLKIPSFRFYMCIVLQAMR